MLIWSSRIYLDQEISKKRKKYQHMLEKNKLRLPVYCITLPINGENTMEIYSSQEFWFQYYRHQNLTLIGLAKTKESARMLVAQICLDMVCRSGDVTPMLIQEYFQN